MTAIWIRSVSPFHPTGAALRPAGTDYKAQHTKSTIIVTDFDLEKRRLGYFHNAGYYELEGDDFVWDLQIGGRWEDHILFARTREEHAFSSPTDDDEHARP